MAPEKMHSAFLTLAAIALFSANEIHAEGLDKLYEKPFTDKSWGQLAADVLGYDDFTSSYALVVGISEYTGGYSRLPTEKDPIEIRNFLIHEAGFDYVHILTDEKATYARIRELMVNIFPRLVDGDDRFFFYWSGHGTQRNNRRGGQDGFLPLASSARDDFASMVSMGDIGRWDNAINGRHVLFFLDACLSGLAGTASMAERRQVDLNDMVRPAHHLITAGTSDEETIAGDRWGGSVFTYAFLRAVRGAADTDSLDFPKDGVVSLFELIKYLRDYVPGEARSAGWDKSITPQLRDLGGSDGDFFFLTSDEPKREGKPPSGESREGEAIGKGDDAPSLAPSRILEVQKMLAELGFQPGEPDGVLGVRTRAAIIAFQRSIGEPATGNLTEAEERQIAIAYADHLAKLRAGSDGQQATSFPDCADCPEMMMIPAGSFLMGSPESEEARDSDEGPQRQVSVSSFALGKYEVTFDEWDACVAAGGCRHRPKDWREEKRGQRPVINVSWEDAKQYTGWLSKITGESYRLPSEAEWEYAARAGTQSPFYTGRSITTEQANFDGRKSHFGAPIGIYRNDTMTVGSFAPNPFGLYDMHGNVREWVEDLYHDDYKDAPVNAAPWVVGQDARRVVRGGSWINPPAEIRSAERDRFEITKRYLNTGFRVAR